MITLGYGHLLGAALPALRRTAARGALVCAVWLVGVATALALYTAATAVCPALPFLLVGLSVWHVVENDLALARPGPALAPLARGVAANLPSLAGTALVSSLAALALPDPGRLGDVFSAVTLHHLVAWLAHRVTRGVRLASLAWIHALPAAACGALWLAPDVGLRAPVFSPAFYLFWSALHVVQTAWPRRPV